MNPRNRFLRCTAGLLASGALIAALNGCGDDMAGPGATDVDGYVRSLPAWTDFAPNDPPSNEVAGDESDPVIFTVGPTEYSCTTTPYSLTQTPDKITIFNPDSEIMWLGALLQGKGHRDGLGSLAELTIRQRGPLKIWVDLLTEDNAVTVENPDAQSVSSAIGGLIAQATAVGHLAGSNTSFDMKRTHSVRQASLELGVSARYLGTTVESELSYQEELEENTLTAYFVQRMFTTNMVLPQTPGAMFSDAFTRDDLQQQIDAHALGPDNLPTYISSIVWGRMLMVTMTSSHSFQEMEAALTATNAAIGGGTISVQEQQVIDESTFKISTVGGNDQGVENLIRTGQLGTYFDADLALTQARPLSYTVRNLGDNSIATVSETTNYNLKQCTTGPATATGARYKVTIDKIVHVSNGCDGVFSPDPEIFYSISITDHTGTRVMASTPGNSSTPTVSPGGSLPASPGPNNPSFVNLYKDGRTGTMTVSGNAWDYDSGSSNELIGSWSLPYAYGVSTGQRYYTRSGNGCSVRLFLTITKDSDLFD
jgi:hypothetical protein